jgi:hypothetical protein
MLRNYYFYPAGATLTIVIAYSMVLPFAAAGNHQLANATNKVEYDSTSTICIDDRPCVTTICINNQQCHIITSNYTNAGNSTNNKHSIVSPFPQKRLTCNCNHVIRSFNQEASTTWGDRLISSMIISSS